MARSIVHSFQTPLKTGIHVRASRTLLLAIFLIDSVIPLRRLRVETSPFGLIAFA